MTSDLGTIVKELHVVLHLTHFFFYINSGIVIREKSTQYIIFYKGDHARLFWGAGESWRSPLRCKEVFA